MDLQHTSELAALMEMDGSNLIITHSLSFLLGKKSLLPLLETFSVQFAISIPQPSMVWVFISFVSDNTHSRLFG